MINNLTIMEWIQLKTKLYNRGMRFQFYSLMKVSATKISDNVVSVYLPGIYCNPIEIELFIYKN